MLRHLHLDFESFSATDLRDVGCYRYSFDPSTQILVAGMALDEGEPVAWDCTMEEWECDHLQPYFDALRDPNVLVYAHNAMMEASMCQALLQKTFGIPCPDLSRFRCTASLARRAALPAKLETLAETLQLKNLKDNRGKALIKKFSVMQSPKKSTKANPDGFPARRIMPADEPEAFAEFVEYCRQDVRTEQEVARRLAYFDEPINNANYTLDAKINARGVPVNLAALRHAQKLIDEETEIVSRKFRELVGFEVTQNARLLEWVNEQGYSFENLQAETVDTFLEQRENSVTTDAVVQALSLKQSIAYVSIKKVKKMLECAGPHDNRIRGTLIHHGATTGRWTASLTQFQNMKRPTIKDTDKAYADICAGTGREMMEICYGPVLEVISSCIRHFVQDAGDCPECGGFGDCGACDGDGYREGYFHDADYSGVEARVVCWLAGEEEALKRFRTYDAAPAGSKEKKNLDPYRGMAADVYRKKVEDVVPFPERFVGKGLVLGAGFKLSGAGFQRQCLDQAGYEISDFEADKAITLWRQKHPKVVQWWKDLDKASKGAILQKGKVFQAGKVSFCCLRIEGTEFLLMKLPSGRKISYPRPRLVPGKFEGSTQIEYWGNIKGEKWGWCRAWEGVLANNATQGTANDLLFNGAHNCEREAYHIVSVIHDQSLAEAQEGQSSEHYAKLLTDLPEWAAGLPLAAEGGLVPYYRKD